jgi:hypothetical protein
MGLSEAILSIADAMENESVPDQSINILFKSFARELRTAVKAAEGIKQTSWNPHLPAAKEMMIQQQMEARKIARQLEREEQDKGFRTVELADDPGVMVSVDPDMVYGDKVNLSGKMYELRKDGKLHPCVAWPGVVMKTNER